MPTGSIEFIDTNILIYEWDVTEPVKSAKAAALLQNLGGRGVISSQIAQEFSWIASKKLGLTTEEVSCILKSYSVFGFVSVDIPIIQDALIISNQNIVNIWDALILSTAASAGCKTLFTEDLNHGQKVRGVKIINPFL